MMHQPQAMGDALWDILGEEMAAAAGEHGLPPGFRFHPTDEELVTFYLAAKVFNGACCGVDIAEVDINRCEPWELPGAAQMGEREWYFFSLRDRKYPTGLRTNRATGAGYWKATGKDREVICTTTGALIGMKKTLVFYKGRAPRGEKTKWVLHEYRLDGDFAAGRRFCKEEWVICRIFHKALDQYSKMVMSMSPYYHATDPSSFCFQQEPPHAALPLPNPSICSGLAHALPFHHSLENHHQGKSNIDTNGLPAASSLDQPNGSGGVNMCDSSAMPMLPAFPSFASVVVTGKAAPHQPEAGVNAGPPEPKPPTLLDDYIAHSGFLYEMSPPAAPRGA